MDAEEGGVGGAAVRADMVTSRVDLPTTLYSHLPCSPVPPVTAMGYTGGRNRSASVAASIARSVDRNHDRETRRGRGRRCAKRKNVPFVVTPL